MNSKYISTTENNMKLFQSLPAEDFKEFFMKYLTYRKGDRVNISDFTNPLIYAIFTSFIPTLDKMEDKYNDWVEKNINKK